MTIGSPGSVASISVTGTADGAGVVFENWKMLVVEMIVLLAREDFKRLRSRVSEAFENIGLLTTGRADSAREEGLADDANLA